MLIDRTGVASSTTGTGTITLGAALGAVPVYPASFDSFANAGAVDGQTYSYLILDANGAWEYGRGTYTASGTTLTRGPIRSSSGTGAISLSGSEQVFVSLLKEDIRELLLANRTYYVRTDGSDSNNGFANTAGGAFLTLQKAWDTVAMLDMSIYSATIQVADGTYTSGILVAASPIGGSSVTIQGNSGTPANVVISTTSASCFDFSALRGWVIVKDMKVQTTTSGRCVYADGPSALVHFGNLNFGACAQEQVYFAGGARGLAISNYTITGGATYHTRLNRASTFGMNTITVTLSGTLTFFNTFIDATLGSFASIFNSSYTGGTITAVRYTVSFNAGINTFGGGANFFPGNSAGTTATGGQYG